MIRLGFVGCHRLMAGVLGLVALLFCSTSFAAETGVTIKTVKPGATVKIENVIQDGKILVSVHDGKNKPVFGLNAGDFSVSRSRRTAKITTVDPMSENKDVPRHIVLVMDNSYSMYERKAINALLSGVNELLKTIRPIDDVRIVVFNNNKMAAQKGRELNVLSFISGKTTELHDFLAGAYKVKGLTGGTYLYDAMLEGLEHIKTMPTSEPRFMVVFSDGEDLNSTFTGEEVLKSAKAIEGLNIYAIDYMERPETNKFLTKISKNSGGDIWKAKSEANIIPDFQSVASKMQYYYVVSYIFPPTGTLAATQASLTIDEVKAGDTTLATGISAPALTLRSSVDSVYGIARWKATATNKSGVVAELSGEGTPGVEISLPLPVGQLKELAANGDIKIRLDLEDRRGQKISLAVPPITVKRAKSTASMTASPAGITVDEVRSTAALPVAVISTTTVTLHPALGATDWVSRWKAEVSNARGIVAELSGQGTPGNELKLSLPAVDLLGLAAGGNLLTKLTLENRAGQSLVMNGPAIPVRLVQTSGVLHSSTTGLKIEEIKTVDYSPMLGHIYFGKGESAISSRYVRFADPGETAGFDEKKYSGTLDKYYQDLNIIGKRLAEAPNASVKLIGCNDNTGSTEKNNKKLSNQRAMAVRDYFQKIWGIAPERMTIETRNLPAKPSAAQTKAGQEENRRVEIVSADPALLNPILSTYFTTHADTQNLTLRPSIQAPNGIAEWKMVAVNGSGTIADLSGKGTPPQEILIPIAGKDLKPLAQGGDITMKMEVKDGKGQKLTLVSTPVKVEFIESSKLMAQKQDMKTQEKYALILFEFNNDSIKSQNQEIVNRIAERVKALPQSTIEIVGYTDNIGKVDYNLKLSERRALSVYKMLLAVCGNTAGSRIRYKGAGPNSPLFNNLTPEARSFNRTVTIILEYTEQ